MIVHRPVTLRLLGLLAAGLFVIACTGDAPSDPEDPSGASDPAADDEAADDGAADDPAATDGSSTTDDRVEHRAPSVPIPGVTDIALDAPATDAGTHPTLAWEAVEGAERYHLTVLDGDDRPVWAWGTAETSVVFGGFDTEPPAHARGPQLHAPMWWQVQARDADGRVIAQSGRRPIAP